MSMQYHAMHYRASFQLAAIALLLITACGKQPATPAESTLEPVLVEVRTAAFETVPRSTRASGTVVPWRRVSPGTKILGRVAQVTVRAGDRVERGALLARLEGRDLKAAVDQAEAAVRVAEATLDNARSQHARMIGLHDRGSVTDKRFEDATAAFEIAEAARAQALAHLAAARVTLSYANIRSPLSGWVVARQVEVGDMATPGASLFTLEDLSQVKVLVQVPEAEVEGLVEGTVASVEILDRKVAATVNRVVPAGDPATRTFSVKLILDNPDGAFKSGMFARVRFARDERQALRVEASALVTRGQLEGLFVANQDGRVRLRWVKTGQTLDGRTEILSGFEAGERYLPTPPPGLVDGAAYRESGR